MTEHGMTVFLDEGQDLGIGTPVEITVSGSEVTVSVAGTVVGVRESRSGSARKHTVELLDFGGNEEAYWQLLYDRVPTLPQSLHRDFGAISHLWQNIAHRVARTEK